MDQRDEIIENLTVAQHAWIRWVRTHLSREGLIAQDFVPSNTEAMALMDQLICVPAAPDRAEVVTSAAPIPPGHVFATSAEAIAYMEAGGVIAFQGGFGQRCIIARDWYYRYRKGYEWELTDKLGFSRAPNFYTALGMRADLDDE